MPRRFDATDAQHESIELVRVTQRPGSDKVAGADWIPWAKPCLWGKEQAYLLEALASTWISGGPFVERLESQFRSLSGARQALSASNGTTALHMAYLALGVGPGDEVILPGFGFLAGANVALHLGATPVFAEVDRETWCLSPEHVEPLINRRTKVIVAVHTYGNVCDVEELLALSERRGIYVLEDAAEALGSRRKSRFAGTMGVIGTFSFQATKTITTGEGGMVVTERQDLHDLMGLYRNHGMRERRYWHEVPGHNFRLTNLQAALGCAQLEEFDRIATERARVHACYSERFAAMPGVIPQLFPDDVEPVLWAIAVELNPRAYPQGRDTVMQQMCEAGIETRPGFYAASRMSLYGAPELSACTQLSERVISLPTFAELKEDEIERICESLMRLRD